MSEAALREALDGLRRDREALQARRPDPGPGRLVIPANGLGHVLPLARVLYAERSGGRVHFHLDGGEIFTANTAFTLDDLADTPLRRVHERYAVNLANVRLIGPPAREQKGHLLYLGADRRPVPLVAPYLEPLREALGLQRLDHVVPWNDRYQAILDENLRTFETPIQTMPTDRLREEFRYPTVDRLEVRQLISNMIWQYHSWLGLPDGDPRRTWPIDGNIRTFWYHIKPVLSRLGVLDAPRQYDQMIDVFGHLVVNRKFFRYKDFGFVDEGESNRKLPPEGSERVHVVLVAEKAGHFRKLEKLQAEFGITIVALGGGPSRLSAEYFVDELAERVDLKATPLRLISLVDYDPAGDIIISSFRKHLMGFGIKRHTVSHVLTPARFTPEELPNVVFEVPMTDKDDRTKTERWIAQGGGIDGKPLGIECEALVLDYGRLRRIVTDLVDEADRPLHASREATLDPLDGYGLPRFFSVESLDDESFWSRWADSKSPRA